MAGLGWPQRPNPCLRILVSGLPSAACVHSILDSCLGCSYACPTTLWSLGSCLNSQSSKLGILGTCATTATTATTAATAKDGILLWSGAAKVWQDLGAKKSHCVQYAWLHAVHHPAKAYCD